MRAIELTKGLVAIVDDEDFERLAQYRWCADQYGYALRAKMVNWERTRILMHHEIIGKPPVGFHVDHINGNPQDNRRCNLRIVSPTENQWNRRRKNKNNKTGYYGVSYAKREKRFYACISVNYKTVALGMFKTAEEAARARDAAAKTIQGDFAVLNFPE